MELLSNNIVALLAFVIFFLLMFLKMPIAIAFAVTGFFGLVYKVNFQAAMGSTIALVWDTFTSIELMAVPLFILMGLFAYHSDIGPDLYNAASKWLGRLPGGLAIATTWGCAAFGAVTGSSATGIMTFGPIAYAPMMKKGYSQQLAAGAICCSSSMGILIPPSIPFIIYAVVTEESVGKLFIAGIIPGILQALMYSVLIVVFVILGIWKGPAGQPCTWKERFTSLVGIWGMLILFIIVIGGLYGGLFTPTEGASMGAFGSFVILLARKGFRWTPIKQSLIETLRISCMAYTITAGAVIFSQFVAITNVNQLLSEWIISLHVQPWIIISIILLFYFILGFPMPAIPMILLTVPTLYPTITHVLGLNGIWFGVLTVIMIEIANISPPVGINLFVTQSLYKDLPIGQLYRGVIPFMICDLVRTAILVAIPALSLWLPSLMYRT